MSKYLFIGDSGILEGTSINREPNEIDLLLEVIGDGVFQIIRNGIFIVKCLNTLVSRFGFKILLHSSTSEEHQLDLINKLQAASLQKGLTFPKITAISVYDDRIFRNSDPEDPIIIKEKLHGIWIAGYGYQDQAKSCVRTALSKLLSISSDSRKQHYIIDSNPKVITQAINEGWSTFEIGPKFSFDKALDEIKKKAMAQNPIVESTVEESKIPLVQKVQETAYQTFKDQKERFRLPSWQGGIIRRNSEFMNAYLPRIAGDDALSSGTFTEIFTGKKWYGRAVIKDVNLADAIACKIRIEADFYALFGANVPRIEISTQSMTNTADPVLENIQCPHIMTEKIENLTPYHPQSKSNFNGQISVSSDGTVLPERGLGSILAVGALINDIDIIGEDGKNLGFQKVNENNGSSYVRAFKVGFGQAFNNKFGLEKYRNIRVRASSSSDSPFLEFDKLPKETQLEFLLTLDRISRTPESLIEGLFSREGLENFYTIFGSTPQQRAEEVLKRKSKLLQEYQKDMEGIRSIHRPIETGFQDPKSLEDLLLCIEPNLFVDSVVQIQLTAALDSFLDFKSNPSSAIALLKGESGSGKTYILNLIEKILLDEAAKSPRSTTPKPIYITMKQLQTQNLEELIESNFKEAESRPIVLLIDQCDQQIEGDTVEYFMNYRKFCSIFKYLRIIVACGSQSLSHQQQTEVLNSPGGKIFQIWEILPSNSDQAIRYLKRSMSSVFFDFNELFRKFNTLPSLKHFIATPFTLKLLRHSIRRLEKNANKQNPGVTSQINCLALFESLIKEWFAHDEQLLLKCTGISKVDDAYQSFENFAQDIANKMSFTKQQSIYVKNSIFESFFNTSSVEEIKMKGCPLALSKEGHYSFTHPAFFEFFAAKGLIALVSRDEPNKKDQSYECNVEILKRETGVIGFIKEASRLIPNIEAHCLDKIKASTHPQATSECVTLASLAISILNIANYNFSGLNLSKIRVPKAALCYGIFDSTHFEGADLRGVDFEGAWLRGASFREANIEGAHFGEGSLIQCESRVREAAYSSNGRYIAVALEYGALLYKVKEKTGHLEMSRKFTTQEQIVNTCAFSPNSEMLVFGGQDRTLTIYNLINATSKKCHTAHHKTVTCCAFDRKGHFIVSGSNDYTLKIWDPVTGFCLKTMRNHQNGVTCLAIRPDGQQIVSGSTDYTLRIWHPRTGRLVKVITKKHTSIITCCAYSPNGKIFVSASNDRSVRVWNVANWKYIHVLEGINTPVSACSFSPNGEHLATGSWDGTVRIWEIASGFCVKLLQEHSSSVTSCNYSPDGKHLLTTSNDQTLRICETAVTLFTASPQVHTNKVSCCAIGLGGHFIVSGSDDCTLRLWDSKGTCTKTLEGHTSRVTCCAVSPNGKLIASGSDDETVKLWEAATGCHSKTLLGHKNTINVCEFSPDGKQLTSASVDGIILIWDVALGKVMRSLEGESYLATSCSFSPDGLHLLVGYWHHIMRIWNIKMGTTVQYIEGKFEVTHNCNFSSDGKLIVVGTSDRYVHIWNVKSGKKINSIYGHERPVFYQVFSPDGNMIVSASKDNTVKVWDSQSSKAIVVLRGFVSSVASVATMFVGKNSLYVATGHDDGSFYYWMINGDNVRLIWTSHQLKLNVHSAKLDESYGLQREVCSFLKQRGANC